MNLIKSKLFAATFALSVCGLASAGPVLWVDDVNGNLGKVDVATGNVTMVGNMGIQMTDIAFDPSGNLWGITFGTLYKINTTTAAATIVGNTGTSLNSLVFASDGTLYSANTSLYTLNTTTGAATFIGSSGGYSSSGDLAFVGGNLYLSSCCGDSLFRINPLTGAGTLVGPIGVSTVYGLATDNNINLFGVAGTSVYSINTTTGAGAFLTNYGGHGLNVAYGTAFLTEAGATAVPEPATLSILGLGLLGMTFVRRKQRS